MALSTVRGSSAMTAWSRKELNEQQVPYGVPLKRGEARAAVREAGDAGITAVVKTEGPTKLQEALDGLNKRKSFNNIRPAELPATLNDLSPSLMCPSAGARRSSD